MFTGFDRFSHAGIDLVENPADDHREGHQSEVLDPENRCIGRTHIAVIDQLGYRRPQGGGNQREREAEQDDRRERDSGGEGNQCESHVADEHQDRTDHQHRRAFALVVEEPAEQRSQDHGPHREPAEDVRSLLVGDAQITFEHTRCETLERENRRIVEHAECRNDQEGFAAEKVLQIGDLEGLFGFSYRGVCLGLSVEFEVHDRECDVGQQADAEQQADNGYRTCYARIAAPVSHPGRQAEYGEYAQSGNSHFQAHRQSQFFPREPLDDCTGYCHTGHLRTAAEDHEAQAGELRAGRNVREERIEELVTESAFIEVVAQPVEFDTGTEYHQRGRKNTRKPYAHLVEDDTCDEQETADVQNEFRTAVQSENRGAPASGAFEHVLQRREDIDEHVAEEHGERHQNQRGPPSPRRVVQFLLNSLCHSLLNWLLLVKKLLYAPSCNV